MPCEAPKQDAARQGRRQSKVRAPWTCIILYSNAHKGPLSMYNLHFSWGCRFKNGLCDISLNLLWEVSCTCRPERKRWAIILGEGSYKRRNFFSDFLNFQICRLSVLIEAGALALAMSPRRKNRRPPRLRLTGGASLARLFSFRTSIFRESETPHVWSPLCSLTAVRDLAAFLLFSAWTYWTPQSTNQSINCRDYTQGHLHHETWWICGVNDNKRDGLWNKFSLKMILGRVSDPGGWVHAGGCRAYAGNGRAKAYRRTRLPLEQSQISPITPEFALWKMTLCGYPYGKCHDQIVSESIGQTNTYKYMSIQE